VNAKLVVGASISLLVARAAAAAAPPPDPTRFPAERRTLLPGFRAPAAGGVKIAFFDADSTLRVAPSGTVSANSPTDVAILPLVAPRLVALAREGYLLAIVSNQAGIAHGHVTFQAAQGALVYTMSQLSRLGVTFHYFDFAEGDGEDRKPQIGMGRRLSETVKERLGVPVDWSRSIMVGDSAWKRGVDVEPYGTPGEDFSNADRLFAENLTRTFGGLTFHHPRVFFHWLRHGIRNFPDFKSLAAFIAQHPELDPGVN
jgi:DNA 3'-phosphatase